MDQQVSRSTVVPAPPEDVFDFLTRPANHVAMDGSGQVRGSRDEHQLTGVGDRFGMSMRVGVPYRITNTVVEYEQDRRLAWRHLAGHRWRFELEPTAEGTRVTETFDAAPAWPPMLWYRMAFDFPEGYARTLERTLERLRELVPARTG